LLDFLKVSSDIRVIFKNSHKGSRAVFK
jgi:hypothetical protein